MKKNIIFLAMSSCFILGTSIAHADSDSSQGKMDDKIFKVDEKTFKAMDKNSDGKVAGYEYKEYTKKNDLTDFNTWDIDGDDNITPTEVKIVNKRNVSQPNSGGSSGEAGKKDDSTRSGGTPQSGQH